MSKIYALLVDDDIKWSQSIIIEALEAHNIELHHAKDLEEMKASLEKYPQKYSSILLDIIGLKEKNQSSADQSFIAAALKFLDHSYSEIPRIIVTGEKGVWDSAKKFWQEEVVFQKEDQDLNKMFELIKKNSFNYHLFKIKNRYKDIFSVLQKQYPDEEVNNKLNILEQSLIELLKKCNEGDKTIIKGNLTKIRTIQETVFQCLHWIDRKMLPVEPYDTNGNLKFHKFRDHLKTKYNNGVEFVPDTIFYMLKPIYVISSKYGPHVPGETPTYSPTKYTVQAFTFALLDFLKWFGILLTKYNS